MNIRGLERLMQEGFPIMRNTFMFKKLSEIPKEHMDAYADQPRWIMRGFDYANSHITDHPYDVKEARVLAFPRKRLRQVFQEVNRALSKKKIPKENRRYFIAEVFIPENTEITGMALRDSSEIYIDIERGVRKSRTDWDPKISFHVPVYGDRPQFSNLPFDSEYREIGVRVVKDLLKLGENTHLDFCLLKDGYFFYHDLVKIERQ